MWPNISSHSEWHKRLGLKEGQRIEGWAKSGAQPFSESNDECSDQLLGRNAKAGPRLTQLT
jgi:hypothetical protein